MVQSNIEVYIYFLSAIPFLIASLIAIRYYLKKKYAVALSFTMAFLICFVVYILVGFAEILLESQLLIYGDLLLSPMTFFFAYTSDFVQKESIDLKKIILVAGVSGAYFFSAALPGAAFYGVNVFGDTVVKWGGWFDIFGSLLYLFSIMFFAILVFRVNQQAKITTDLNRPARKLWFAIVLYCVAMALAIIPIAGYQLFQAGGMLIMCHIFFSQPKLLFLLPFKPLRLTVLHNASGLSIFTHTWKLGMSMADENLFAGMLQGVSLILKESMNRGDLRELSLTQGILLFHSSEESPITCALAATRSSKTLRDALAGFHERFMKEFEVPLSKRNYETESSLFDQVSELVETCFPFVPEYELEK